MTVLLLFDGARCIACIGTWCVSTVGHLATGISHKRTKGHIYIPYTATLLLFWNTIHNRSSLCKPQYAYHKYICYIYKSTLVYVFLLHACFDDAALALWINTQLLVQDAWTFWNLTPTSNVELSVRPTNIQLMTFDSPWIFLAAFSTSKGGALWTDVWQSQWPGRQRVRTVHVLYELLTLIIVIYTFFCRLRRCPAAMVVACGANLRWWWWRWWCW